MTNLLEAFVSNQFSNGYTICDENDIGDILYIVKEGSVVCT